MKGAFPAPERADPLGKRFLYHAPTGTVRSEGLAGIVVQRTLSVLQTASSKFRRGAGSWAQSLEDLAGHFGRRIAQGKTMPMEWEEVMKGGLPPEHPLAAWGERYSYDPGTGKVDATWKGDSGGGN